MLDEYVMVDHHRNSPEADVPVLEEHTRSSKLGGAANVAMNIKALGSNPYLISIAGSDLAFAKMQDILNSENIDNKLVLDDTRPTTVKTRFIDQNYKQFFRLDKELRTTITKEITADLIHLIDTTVSERDFDAIIIQDYNKGLLHEELIRYIQNISKDRSIPLFVDPKTDNFELLSYSDFFKANLNEIKQFLGSDTAQNIQEITELAFQNLPAPRNLIITLGDKGIYFKNSDITGNIEAHILDNADVSGAGDTVISALCVFHLNGYDLKENALLSNKAGAISCSKKGVSTVTYKEIQEFNA